MTGYNWTGKKWSEPPFWNSVEWDHHFWRKKKQLIENLKGDNTVFHEVCNAFNIISSSSLLETLSFLALRLLEVCAQNQGNKMGEHGPIHGSPGNNSGKTVPLALDYQSVQQTTLGTLLCKKAGYSCVMIDWLIDWFKTEGFNKRQYEFWLCNVHWIASCSKPFFLGIVFFSIELWRTTCHSG